MSDFEINTTLPRNSRAQRKPRTVSSLTTQQIQRKRDLDRKAQRTLRQRVKSQVQELEQDLARVKSCLSDRERSMMAEVQPLREENRRLRSCLERIGQFAFNGVSIGKNRRRPDSAPITVRLPICLLLRSPRLLTLVTRFSRCAWESSRPPVGAWLDLREWTS